ncbi:NTP transferase domain-containing protein [uncultured Candidatus Kuenenia sp.]|jgi:bifunctional UDP-N-acetylglucosamine pyrophosphorylase/glucosamine-1-phosphate N-acetyltransferase|uniref:NTP transferase domain-containing protein n=1 Tax=Candidatus Kuenenia sp. TaxID=2499824 RepID=UPI00030EE40D|nr:NTP transferase domain-containing protein [uncultured Candidatus Kuenenia sp.]MBE7548022.1 bifunctional N-acetylglucosamine-1-phosphate uridyltransferase/glucosamine-1-phosphate acetyltransferase [Planctomycetia bacterium]TVM02535.1 MAG: hypothetical protein CV080_00365 [Candidatus Kuenenia stuttgartiensis]
MKKITAVILAAGKGTRMRSPLPKVLHEVCGSTLLECVICSVQKAEIPRIIIVVGDKKEEVGESLEGLPVEIVEQREQLGTAHAVIAVKERINSSADIVLILNGDAPLIKPRTLKRLISINNETAADVVLLTARLEKPKGYGRIYRDKNGSIAKIIEESEADGDVLAINEINAGIYAFKTKALLEGLSEVQPHNKKGEFYLTDIISILHNKGKKIEGIEADDAVEVLGINTQQELAIVNKIRHDEILQGFMESGVTIVDTGSTFVENNVEIGAGTKIYPFSYINKNVVIGRYCRIGPFAYLESGTKVSDGTVVKSSGKNGKQVF